MRHKPVASAAGGEMEEGIIEDVEELDTVIAELEISKGKGNLILCVVNSPLYRDRIIQTLEGRFKQKIIDVKKGEQIINILKRKDFDGADVLMWIMPEEADEDILNTLNNYRELFYESKIPNVVFYNQGFSESVIRKAPDFWRYRGNYYEFKEAERGFTFEALEVLTTPLAYKDKEDLLRKKRINEYLLENIRNEGEKSKILSDMGTLLLYLGELDNSLEYFKQSLKLNKELKNKAEIAGLYGNIGIIYVLKGEFDKALKYHEDALKLNEELENKEGFARDLGNIGIIYALTGKSDDALEYFQKSLGLNNELGINEGIAAQLGNIGIIYRIKGELRKAEEYFRRSLELFYELGRYEGVASQRGNLGIVYETKGEFDNALAHYNDAFEIFRNLGNKIGIAKILTNIGNIFVLLGKKKAALDYFLKAQNLAAGSYISENISERIKTLKQIT